MNQHLSLDEVFNKLNMTIEDLQNNFPEIETKALNTGANILKRSVVESMISRWPASGRPFTVKVPKKSSSKKPYITKADPISTGVKQSKRMGDTVRVSVAGALPHTAGYLAKMYEHDSRPRYTNKPKAFRGKLTGKQYFSTGINSAEQECFAAMERIITNRLNEMLNELQ